MKVEEGVAAHPNPSSYTYGYATHYADNQHIWWLTSKGQSDIQGC